MQKLLDRFSLQSAETWLIGRKGNS